MLVAQVATATETYFSVEWSAGPKAARAGVGGWVAAVCGVSLFPWEARLKFKHKWVKVSRTAPTDSQEASN